MLFCYSATQKSKIYAEVLGAILALPVYMLESDIDVSHKTSLFIKGVWKAVLKQTSPVLNMPRADVFSLNSCSDGKGVYICGPVWGGYPAAPVRYFLENAHLKGKRVNMLLTSSVSHTSYSVRGRKMLNDVGCNPGFVEVFATGGVSLERDVIESHIREMFFYEGEK